MIELRSYQEDIVDSLRVELVNNDIVLVYAPTGAGKTIISKWLIQKIINKNLKCLFTTPRIKLATQTQKSFGFGNLLLGAKTKDNKSMCTVASVQSLYSRKIDEHFDYIFIDEAHFGHGSEFLKYIFETYPNSKIIGLSATPIDENGYLLSGYQSIVKVVGTKDLIAKGHLTDVEVFTSKNQPDFSKVDVVKGDYNQKQVGAILQENDVLSNTIEEWLKIGFKLKTIMFVSSISQAEKYMEKFGEINIKAARVHSKMKEKEVEQAYSDFHDNTCQVLINVDMATFGFDEPSIECMLFARGIKSLRLYKQMVGRGIRTFPGKEKCIMIDCANVIFDNGYPTDEIVFIKKPIINKTVDRLVKIERDTDGSVSEGIVKTERIEYLEKIGSLIDLYRDKIYAKEQDLVDDCKKILRRGGFYMWRQNSGKAYMKGRWVAFTDRNGLPDITLIYKSLYIGLELKLPKGRLTTGQKKTLPEFIVEKIHFFIIESVIDLFEALETIQGNIVDTEDGTLVKKGLFDLDEKQRNYRIKYKINQD